MNQRREQLAWSVAVFASLASLAVGVLLPALSASARGSLVNVPWDTAYGLGYLPLMVTRGRFMAPPLQVFGYMVWPLVLAFVVAVVIHRLLARRGRLVLVLAVLLLGASLVFNTSAKAWRASPLIWWPSYTKSSSVIW